MPNPLKQCLGQTGRFVTRLSQDFVDKRAYVSEGACLSICAQFMCGINTGDIPTKKDYLEVGQWMKEEGGFNDKLTEYVEAHGMKLHGELKGRLLYDELWLSTFVNKTDRPYYYIVGVSNTQRTKGHAFLIYRSGSTHPDGSGWYLMDPNCGLATFPLLGACLLAFKRLLNNAYSGAYGPSYQPYFPFHVWRYTPAG